MFKILIPGVACVVTAPATGQDDFLAGALAEGYQIVYIIADDGTKYMHRVFGKDTAGNPCFARYKVKTIPGFSMGSNVTEENKFLPAGKVPVTLLMEVQKFFKAVIAKFGGGRGLEAMIWIMYNEEQGYFLHVPTQKVGGASVEYGWGDLPRDSSGKVSRIIVDIHSHADFGAFFSGTDDNDDRNSIRYSGVIGHNLKPEPEMKFRWNFGETKIPLAVTDIFSYPTPEVQDTPDAWLEKVETHSYAGYQGGSSYPNYNQGGWHGGHHGGWQSQGHYNHHGGYTGQHGTSQHITPPEARATLVKPESEPTPVYSSAQVLKDAAAPKPWTAPKPANATVIGKRGGADGWFLDDGGFISFAMWEQRYPAARYEQAEARRKAAMNAETAKVVGGQQGTRPLALTGPTGPSSPMSSHANQARGASASDFLFPTEQSQGKEKPKSNGEPENSSSVSGIDKSLNSSDGKTPSSQSPTLQSSNSPATSSRCNPEEVTAEQMARLGLVKTMNSQGQVCWERPLATDGQTRGIRLPSATATSSSQGHSTGPSSQPLSPEVKGKVQAMLDGTALTPTTTTPSGVTGHGRVADPLTVFTDQVRASLEGPVLGKPSTVYISTIDDHGAVTLKAVELKSETDAALEELQAGYQQELREAQNALQNGRQAALLEDTTDASGAAPMGVVPVAVEAPQLQPRTASTTSGSDFRDRYVEGSRSLPVTGGATVQGGGPAGDGFSVPRLQTRTNNGPTLGPSNPPAPVAPTLVRTSPTPASYFPANRYSTEPIQGSFVDDWLARKRASIDGRALPESAIERMHNRAQNEALLHDAEDAAQLRELQEGAVVLNAREFCSEEITVMPDNTIVLRVAGDDLPSFNADVIDYGLKPAGAKAVIEVGLKTIQEHGRDSIKRKLVEDVFELLDEDQKLPMFRTLASSLPESARDDLATNGL